MRRLTAILVVLFSITSMNPAFAKGMVTNTKLGLHGATPVSADSAWQAASWVLLPDFDTDPSKMVAVVGPHHQVKTWWLECNVGALVVGQDASALLDLRASHKALSPVLFSANVQYVPKDGFKYLYFDADYKLPYGCVGLETEDRLPRGKDDLCIGVHLTAPFKTMVLVWAYQWHEDGNQLWIRGVLLSL